MGSSGKVKIGNNVFIGMNSTILKNTTIGDNVIIGANSLVRGIIPSNCIIAGNPAKIICSLDDYYNKRITCQLNEAKEIAKEYFEVYHRIPPKNVFHEFFWLFEQRNCTSDSNFDSIMKLTGNYDKTLARYKKTQPIFKSYQEFISYCNLTQ